VNTAITKHTGTRNSDGSHDINSLRKTGAPILITLDIKEQALSWSAVSRNRKTDHMVRGAANVGYFDITTLSDWLSGFLEQVSDVELEIHIIISGPEMVQRCFRIPKVTQSETEAVLKSVSRKLYPFELRNSLFGWRISDSVEWAGGPKFEVFSQGLSGNWRGWLQKLFGDYLNSVSFITSPGLYLERIFHNLIEDFARSDTLLIRLNGCVAETGIFHKGHLEFYREVAVDSLAEDNAVYDLKRMIGDDDVAEPNGCVSPGEVVSSLRSVIGDVLDYYHGQFGKREIKRVVSLVPSEYSSAVTEFAQESIASDVIDINTESFIARHSRLAGIASDFSDYPVWITSYPSWKIKSYDINLLPEEIKSKKTLKQRKRAAGIVLVLAILCIMTLSVLKVVETRSLENRFESRNSLLTELKADPVLPLLNAFENRAQRLRKNMRQYVMEGQSSIKVPLLILSRNSKSAVRLDVVEINRIAGSLQANISGIVTGPNDRQEAEYYTYLRSLENDNSILAVNPGMKRVETQLGNQKLGFTFELSAR